MPDEVTSTVTAEDTASAAPAQDSAPAVVTPPTSDPAPGTGSEQPLGSSTPSPAEAPKPNAAPATNAAPVQPTAPPVDWQKRYSDLQSNTDRRLNQMQQKMQTSSQEMESLRQFRQQQEQRAQQLNLKPWSKQHPDYNKFQSVLGRAKTIEQQLNAIPKTLAPEQQQAISDAILSAVTPEDRQQLQTYREEVQNFQRGFFEDPVGTLGPMLVPLIQEQMREATARAQANHQVEKDFESPELKPLVQEHAAEIQQALAAGVPYDHAIHMVKMYGELTEARKQLSALNKDAVMGREQQRLAKNHATITRDPAPSQTADSYSLAKKEAERLGITTDDPRFFKLLKRFDKDQPSIFNQPPKSKGQ